MRRQTAGPGQRWPAGRQPPGFSDPQQDWVSEWQTDERFWMSAETAGPELAGDERWAMLSYLGVPFLTFLVPLAIYLIKMRSSRYIRCQAAQAFNLSVTVLLYSVCVLILGVMLTLDNPGVALLIAVPLAAALWLVALGYVIRAGMAASRGDYYPVPSWICATIAR
jgi:uncharacterized Tic20 family protein